MNYKNWIQLLVLNLAVLIVSVDTSVLDVAIPTLQQSFHPSGSGLLWMMDIYSFMLAGMLLPFGALGDSFGSKKILLGNSIGFGIASLLAAYANTSLLFILARALQGVTAAGLMPATLALIRRIFSDSKNRLKAVALWNASFYAGGILGPLVGGYLLEHFWWGSIFLLNIPIVVLLIILGSYLLPETHTKPDTRIDFYGSLLFISAMLPLIYSFKNLITSENSKSITLLIGVLGIFCSVLFWRHLKSPKNNLIDVSLFKNKNYLSALMINLLTATTALGILFYTMQYLQLVLGYSPLRAALIGVPAGIISIIASIIVGNIAYKYLPRTIITVGLIIAALGCILLYFINFSPLWIIFFGVILLALGNNLVDPITNNIVVSASENDSSTSSAAALSETSYELGSALGITFLGGITQGLYKHSLLENNPASLGVTSTQLHQAANTIGEAKEIVKTLPPKSAEILDTIVNTGYTHAVQLTSLITGLLILVGIIGYNFSDLKNNYYTKRKHD